MPDNFIGSTTDSKGAFSAQLLIANNRLSGTIGFSTGFALSSKLQVMDLTDNRCGRYGMLVFALNRTCNEQVFGYTASRLVAARGSGHSTAE